MQTGTSFRWTLGQYLARRDVSVGPGHRHPWTTGLPLTVSWWWEHRGHCVMTTEGPRSLPGPIKELI